MISFQRRAGDELRVQLRTAAPPVLPDGLAATPAEPTMEDVFTVGHPYPVAEFVALSLDAMRTASDRVQARWGFPCSRAAATLAGIEARAAECTGGEVTVAGFRRC